MNIIEVSYGCPSKKYPLNGIFQMEQAKAIEKCGNRVVFVAIDIRSFRRWRRWGIYEHRVGSIPVIEFNFPLGPVFTSIGRVISRFGFQRVLRIVEDRYGKPDVVHVHFGETAECLVNTCIQKQIPYVVTEHSSNINRDDLTRNEIKRIERVYRNASAVIAVSKALSERILNYSGVNAVIIPNIVDFSTFEVNKQKHNKFRIVSAANLKKGKGFDVLLEAFFYCFQKDSDFQLLIMGDGPEKKSLMAYVKDRRIEDSVRFSGKFTRSDFSKELSKSDLFVLASRSETFGLVYAEAISCGVPVIATKCGGPEDFVNETNGMLVEVDDVKGLADAIIAMKKRITVYDSDHMSNGIKKQFSSSVIARKINDVLLGTKHA